MARPDILVVAGPTAAGKTAVSIAMAKRYGGEVVSCDSMQLYKYMDIGSAKPTAEEMDGVPHHMVGVIDPRDPFSVAVYQEMAKAAIADIASRGKLPVICGGTALYIAAILDGYRLPGGALPPRSYDTPRIRQNPDAPDSFTPPFAVKPLIMGMYFPRTEVRKRIEARLDARLQNGMIEEIRHLHDDCNVAYETMEFFGLEYREISLFLQNHGTYDEMRSTLLNRIRQFAKRQDIFFRKLEREGHQIYWIKEGKDPDPFALTADFLAEKKLPEVSFRLCEHLNPPSR
jgi:tRNA dimethylallyltransferase